MKNLLIFCLFFNFNLAFTQEKLTEVDSLKKVITSQQGVTKVTSLILLGDTYLNTKQDSAIYFYSQANTLVKDWPTKKLAYEYYLGMSIAHRRKHTFDSASFYLEKVKDVIEKGTASEYSYFKNKGWIAFDKGNFPKSKEFFETALQVAIQLKDESKQGEAYGRLAASLQQLSRYEEAIDMELKAVEIQKRLKEPFALSDRYNNISVLYKSLEQYNIAEEYMLKTIKISDSLGDKNGVAIGYINLGIVKRLQGNEQSDIASLKKAESYYLKALKLSEEINHLRVKSSALVNLINVNNDLKNYDKAIVYGNKSIAFSQSTNNKFGEMLSRLNIGDSYRIIKEFEKSEKELELSLKIANELSFTEGIKTIYLGTSNLYKDKGDYKKSLDFLERHHKLKDSVSSAEVKNKVNELEIKYETAEKERDLAQVKTDLIAKEAQVRRKNTLIYGGFGLAIVLGLLGYLFYNQQKLKNNQLKKEGELKTALAKIETQNKLQEQRLRISRDLHDNIGSQLTFIISSIDNLKFGLKDQAGNVVDKLSSISAFTTTTIYELRDTIWAMNKNEITLEDLQSRIANFIEKAGVASDGTNFEFKVSETIKSDTVFTSVQGMSIYRIIQEAVNNAIKYADASEITVHISELKNTLKVEIKDNGNGFDKSKVTLSNGINNMKKRAKDLKGILFINSQIGSGTTIQFTL